MTIQIKKGMTRSVIIFIITLAFATNLNAQLKKLPDLKSKKIIGGYCSYSIIHYEDDYSNEQYKYLIFELGPEYGGFVSGNVALGANMTYISQHLVLQNYRNYNQQFFSLSPFIRYYFSIGFYLNFQAGMSFEFSKIKDLDKPDNLAWVFDPGIGYAYFLNDNLSIDLKYQYRAIKYDKGVQGISSYKIHSSIIFIGIQAYI